MPEVLMVAGFCLAAYSIFANDSIQTLGTFLDSNARRPWFVLWAYAGAVLLVVLAFGWLFHGGDVSYGRLNRVPLPGSFTWVYCVPPLVILVLTRFGIPVSTTFLVLTVFSPKNLGDMLIKSLSGYVVAFVVAILVYRLVAGTIEKRFLATRAWPVATHWVFWQWASTGFLWSQWLIQDLANLYVFLPRELEPWQLLLSLAGMLGFLGAIFHGHGGEIQKIVSSKTNTTDIRSATFVDAIYGLILLAFKEMSDIPMSTTWVFLGLLAGRELAVTRFRRDRTMKDTGKLVLGDLARAGTGLVVSVLLAWLLPMLG